MNSTFYTIFFSKWAVCSGDICLSIWSRRKSDHQSCLFPAEWKWPPCLLQTSLLSVHASARLPKNISSEPFLVVKKCSSYTWRFANIPHSFDLTFQKDHLIWLQSPVHCCLFSFSAGSWGSPVETNDPKTEQWPLVQLPSSLFFSPAGHSYGLVCTPGTQSHICLISTWFLFKRIVELKLTLLKSTQVDKTDRAWVKRQNATFNSNHKAGQSFLWAEWDGGLARCPEDCKTLLGARNPGGIG